MDDHPYSFLEKSVKNVGFCVKSQGSFSIFGKFPLTFNKNFKNISTYESKGKNPFSWCACNDSTKSSSKVNKQN
jgi:hypothetical protein